MPLVFVCSCVAPISHKRHLICRRLQLAAAADRKTTKNYPLSSCNIAMYVPETCCVHVCRLLHSSARVMVTSFGASASRWGLDAHTHNFHLQAWAVAPSAAATAATAVCSVYTYSATIQRSSMMLVFLHYPAAEECVVMRVQQLTVPSAACRHA